MTIAPKQILESIATRVKTDFDKNRRVLSFDEYLGILAENPARQLRNSAQTVVDMLQANGYHDPTLPETMAPYRGKIKRYHLFDQPIDVLAPKLVGHEEIQTELARLLSSFVQQKRNNKLILLHGPNGSAKSTITHALMAGMERYSQTPEGACYTFNWVFPIERHVKGNIGIAQYESDKKELSTFAKLPEDEVSARIPSELRDHPFLLIPPDLRFAFLKELLGAAVAERVWSGLTHYFTEGNLSSRNKLIFDALLVAYNGEFKKVLRHIQVERFYYSTRYRMGLVTIEPQMHVDAGYHQLTMDRSFGQLPAALQGLSLFNLTGDLIDGNRGIIEFSDFLKRPIDSFKYLLTTCETSAINVGPTIAYLDSVMIANSNELQLDAFKEYPDFPSFKARMELIRVPYLLRVSEEKEIYDGIIKQIAVEKKASPHSAWTLALWTVLTRLKKPNSINYPSELSAIISSLTPLQKAKLYDTGEFPNELSPEERKVLRANLSKLREEYNNIPYYEGRLGASVREAKAILFNAASNSDFPCLSPLGILFEIESFVKRVAEYEFLKQDVKDGYHDVHQFIKVVRKEYLLVIDREIRDCLGLYDTTQWEEFMHRYVVNVSTLLKKEKIQNPVTGRREDPDQNLIDEFEKIIGAPQEKGARELFRQNVIAQVGAWSLDNRDQKVSYAKVFPEYWKKLELHFYQSQKSTLDRMHKALQTLGTEQEKSDPEGVALARQTLKNMVETKGYTEQGAIEVIDFLMEEKK